MVDDDQAHDRRARLRTSYRRLLRLALAVETGVGGPKVSEDSPVRESKRAACLIWNKEAPVRALVGHRGPTLLGVWNARATPTGVPDRVLLLTPRQPGSPVRIWISIRGDVSGMRRTTTPCVSRQRPHEILPLYEAGTAGLGRLHALVS